MDWKLFIITFISIFLAELGDKTQLATMGFAVQNASAKWIIFAASASALVLASFLGVIFGNVILKYISPMYIKFGSAIMFLLIGSFLMYAAFNDLGNKKYEKIAEYLLEKSHTQCIICEKFQNEIDKIDNDNLKKEFKKENTVEEKGCPDCSTVLLRKYLSQINKN